MLKNKASKKEYDKAYSKNNCKKIMDRVLKWQKENPERNNEKSRRWVKTNKDRRNAIIRKSKYGISDEEYKKMLSDQNECCAICGISQCKLKRILHVDHCHITKKVRGLLCKNCNLAIGFIEDNLNSAKMIVKYLSK